MDKYSNPLEGKFREKFIYLNYKYNSTAQEFIYKFRGNGGLCVVSGDMEYLMNIVKKILANRPNNSIFASSKSKYILDKAEGVNKAKSCKEADIFLTDCDFLIEDTGGVVFSSFQLGCFRLTEMAKNIVLFARASQIVGSISDSMRIYNKMDDRPSNITSLQNFGNADGYDNLGSPSKNVFLLLLEDLN